MNRPYCKETEQDNIRRKFGNGSLGGKFIKLSLKHLCGYDKRNFSIFSQIDSTLHGSLHSISQNSSRVEATWFSCENNPPFP